MLAKLGLAIGLVLVVEGTLYALFPSFLRSMLEAMKRTSENTLRLGGLAALAFGVLLIWAVQ